MIRRSPSRVETAAVISFTTRRSPMAREGMHICYTGEEAMTARLLELEKDGFYEAWNVLRDKYVTDSETAAETGPSSASSTST
jgi:hypothetical protein